LGFQFTKEEKMKKALLVLAIVSLLVGPIYAHAVGSNSGEKEFNWAALFVIEGDSDDVEADVDWLLDNDKDGGYVYDTEAVLVFIWNEVDSDFYLQFRINDANGVDLWSDGFYFDSKDDYMFHIVEFAVDYIGTYDVYVYVNGYEWYHGSFESR